MEKSSLSSSLEKAAVLLVVCLTMTLVVPGALVAEENDGLGTFQGNVISTAGRGARGTTLTLRIDRWSTDEEREELLQTIKSNRATTRAQNRAVPDALRAQKRAGLASLSGGRGYPLRFTAQYDLGGGKRRIVLVTNRQIELGEAVGSPTSMDFNVSVVIMEVDEKGNGSGTVGFATELRWDEEKQQLEPVALNTQPARLENVRQTR